MRLLVFFFLLPASAVCQVVTTDPVFPVAGQPLTITVDVSGTSIDHFAWNNDTNPVYIWTWIRKTGSPDIDAPTNVNPATGAQAAAKCTRISVSPDKYQITFTPTAFFNKAASEIPRIGLKLKSKDWSENKQTDVDKFIDFTTGLNVSFTSPTGSLLLFKNTGDQFPITVAASEPSSLTLKINGVVVAAQPSTTTLTYNHTVNESSGTSSVVCDAVSGSNTKTISFTYTVRSPVVQEARPIAIRDGINYQGDNTKATLSLWAPGKTSVYVIGDFTNWEPQASYQMKQDGEHFWLEITGLIPGTEYGYQYLVNETLRIADPYADKVLDPDDQFIPVNSYPGLKTFPAKALSDKWYFNRVAVLQTNQVAFAWKNSLVKPAKERLVIYELLIRDFFGPNARNYQSLIDTLTYLKRLGVNAIELMPVTEFNGNDSWGYNPAFMFAPDKYYGTKDQLKEFIDKCHEKSIAVILDMVMNHHDLPNPYVMLDFDYNAFKPTASNKWFNVEAKHPFNVFFDMNHESAYTKKYLDTVNYHWFKEFRIDGLRYDLSKGFTQNDSHGSVEAWSAYDGSRVAILKRMADKIWSHTPDAYIILEHFAANQEEKELAEYRAAEGKGMMLWSNFNYAYNQCTMGYADGTDISGMYFANRSWTAPHNIGYMESHDEERLVYKNKQFGSAAGGYSVKNEITALDRQRAAQVVFYTIPGPKMLWQFGELGYDLSINTCSDGTVKSECRISAKPVKWEYLQDVNRRSIFNITADLIRLRNAHAVFTSGTATLTAGNSLIKQVVLKSNPYSANPSSESQMNVLVIANLDVMNQAALATFPHTGSWFDYYTMGELLSVSSATQSILLKPGEFKIYTDVKIENPTTQLITGLTEMSDPVIEIYPNPAGNVISVSTDNNVVHSITLVSLDGSKRKLNRIDSNTWDISGFAPGLYVAQMEVNNSRVVRKIFKH